MPLHPQTAVLVEGMAGSDSPPVYEQTPAQAREGYRMLAQLLGPGPEVAVADRSIPGPAGDLPIRVYTPDGDGPHPVLVFFHGGGMTIGDLDTHDRECRILCRDAACVVVSVDYRLGPEHPFPAGVDDATAALAWVDSHAAEIGGDGRRLAVGGDSAGGTLSAVCALWARDNGVELCVQVLVYPGTDARGGHPSLEINRDSPFLDLATIEYFRRHAAGDDASGVAGDWRASPLIADSHADVAPAYLAVCELDPLFDEGQAYGAALREAGVAVEERVFEGQPHLLFQLSPVLDDGRILLEECSAALRDAFA